MRAWLIYAHEDADRNREYIDFYFTGCAQHGVALTLLYAEEITFGIRNGRCVLCYQHEPVDRPDFVICRAIYPLLTRHLEEMGLPVFNNSTVAEICNDKARTYQYVQQYGVNILDTDFRRAGAVTEDSRIPFPRIHKPVHGRGGTDVTLVQTLADSTSHAVAFARDDYVIQRIAPHPGKDLRVYVIGNEIVTAILRTAKTGHRANYCLGGIATVYTLNEQEITTVRAIVRLFDFGFVGVDFLFDHDDALLFNEIEDVVGARAVYTLTDINIVYRYIDYLVAKVKAL